MFIKGNPVAFFSSTWRRKKSGIKKKERYRAFLMNYYSHYVLNSNDDYHRDCSKRGILCGGKIAPIIIISCFNILFFLGSKSLVPKKIKPPLIP